MRPKTWQNIDGVLYFENLGAVLDLVEVFVFVFWLREHVAVILADLEQGVVVGAQHVVGVGMRRRPLIVVEFVHEDLAFEKLLKRESVVDHLQQIPAKQETGNEVVLKLGDVADDFLDGLKLVISEGCVDGAAVKVLVLAIFALGNLVFVENGVL